MQTIQGIPNALSPLKSKKRDFTRVTDVIYCRGNSFPLELRKEEKNYKL
jgi:hypothetical protein